MIKYTNRGLVNDRYYWNMNWSLLRTLFWVGNIVMLVSDQANYQATYLDHGHSIFAYTYRFDCQTLSFVIFHWPRIGSNADILRSQLCRLNVNIEQLEAAEEADEVVGKGKRHYVEADSDSTDPD